jgi:O-antigen biosynthesis protein
MISRAFSPYRIVQNLWHRVPLSGRVRAGFKTLVFRVFAPWFRGTAAYRDWLEQQNWMERGLVHYPRFRGGGSARCGAPALRTTRGHSVPAVSVIIPVCGDPALVFSCLEAIADSSPQAAFEVIVVDAGGAPVNDARTALSARNDIRYVCDADGRGFAEFCNAGARLARGDDLFFLSVDTRVLGDWLSASRSVLSKIPGAGLVGGKILSPDGRINEPDWLRWRQGTSRLKSRDLDPARPAVNYLRDVEGFGGSAVLVRRSLFDAIGGFDPVYRSADYGVRDLSLEVRVHGYRVLYQPFSQAVRYGDACADARALGSADGAHEADRRRFFRKWRDMLFESSRYDTGDSRGTVGFRPKARILVIDACTPMSDRDSGSVDLVNLLRLFASFDYQVTFCPVDLIYAGPYTRALQSSGVECIYSPFEHSVERLLRARGREFDVVMLMRLDQGVRYLNSVRANCPQAKVIFNTVDLHYLREERRAMTDTGMADSAGARRMKRLELDVVRGVDLTILISPIERELLAGEVPDARLCVIPLLRDIPGRGPGFADRRGAIFIGGFRHPPNLDAILWCCRQIWPKVQGELPDVELSIVGSYPSAEVMNLEAKGVHVLGYVEDIAPLFARTRLSIAPLRYGAGLKGKVVTSLGYGVPCVVTPVAAEGLGLADGEGIVVAADPDAFAAAVVHIHGHQDDWERLSMAGIEAVRRSFSLDANRPRLANLLRDLDLPS